MISTTYITTSNSRPINGSSGSWSSRNYVEFKAMTKVILENIKIPFISYVDNALVAIEITVNGKRAYYEDFTLLDSLNEKIYYPLTVNVEFQSGDIVRITAITEERNNYCSPYGSNDNVTYDTPFMTGSGYFWSCIEMHLDINYELPWVIDEHNDGYPYPFGTSPMHFTEFEKDKNGYPLNWGVWKLDNQNDNYPWPTGFIPIQLKNDVLLLMDNYYHKVDKTCAHSNSYLVPIKITLNIKSEDS